MTLNKVLICFVVLVLIGSGGAGYAQPTDNDRARAYYFAAEEAYAGKKYDSAINALDKARGLLGASNARLSALRVKILFEQERYGEAKAALDAFYGFKPADNLARTMASYLLKIDEKIAEEQERMERERLAEIEREKERQAQLEREKQVHAERQRIKAAVVARIEAAQKLCDSEETCASLGISKYQHALVGKQEKDFQKYNEALFVSRIAHKKACALGFRTSCASLAHVVSSEMKTPLSDIDIAEFETVFSKECAVGKWKKYNCYQVEVMEPVFNHCQENHAESCQIFAVLSDADGEFLFEYSKRLSLLDKACKLGLGTACMSAYYTIEGQVMESSGLPIFYDTVESVNMAIRACELDLFIFCKKAGAVLWAGSKRVKKDRKLAKQLYGRYCAYGNGFQSEAKLCRKRAAKL